MKRYKLILPLLLLFLSARGQRFTDIGIFGGTSMYMGDINPSNYFYKPSPSFGGFVRLNLNKRVAVRLNGNYGSVRGSDEDFPDRFLTARASTTFSNTLFDLNGQVEFNWLPYITGEDRLLSSLYVAGGVGYTYFTNYSSNTFTIPFGLGFKINITERLSAGLEWSYRKTFTDRIDNWEDSRADPIFKNTVINNNDLYSVLGLFISYKFVKFAADCPVYN